MTVQVIGTTVEVLGKSYQLKCPENEVESLRNAAHFLEKQMQEVRSRAHVLSVDRIAVFAALTMAHQLLTLETEKNQYEKNMTDRLQDLHDKIEKSFALNAQLELHSAE
jgi:cell division protein ZapA